MRIALKDKVTPRLLMAEYGMSRATAYRYVRAWYDARGLLTPREILACADHSKGAN